MSKRPELHPGPDWGKITELPRPPSWFSGSRFAAGERERGRRRKIEKEEKGRGIAFPHFFFTI